MSSGNMHVHLEGRFPPFDCKNIDAHSILAGDFTVERTVGPKTVYLTENGAKLLDDLKALGFKHNLALKDDLWFKLIGFGIFEKHKGNPEPAQR